jgi:hypothetical protein
MARWPPVGAFVTKHDGETSLGVPVGDDPLEPRDVLHAVVPDDVLSCLPPERELLTIKFTRPCVRQVLEFDGEAGTSIRVRHGQIEVNARVWTRLQTHSSLRV